jgi:hypothetical protein
VIYAELRQTIRSSALQAGICAYSILTIALGIDANLAVYTVIHGVLVERLLLGLDRLLGYPDLLCRNFPIQVGDDPACLKRVNLLA